MSVAVALLLLAADAEITLCVPEDRDLQARIQGQTQDLDGPLPWSSVCWDGVGGIAVAVVGDAGAGYTIVLLRKELPPKTRRIDALSSPSATREAAALAVRALVKIIRLGVEPEWTPEIVLRAPKKAPPTPWNARVALLSSARWTGLGDPSIAAGLRANLSYRRWQFELSGAFGLKRQLADHVTELTILDNDLWVALGYELIDGSFDLHLFARAGIALHRRKTSALSAGVTPTPSRSTAGFRGGPEVRGTWWFTEIPSVGISVSGGADFELGTPRFQYRVDDAIQTLVAGWIFQPRVSLALTMETGTW